MPLTITDEDYSALVELARKGATDKVYLENFLRDIERRNGITRYFLLVQWQEMDTPLPPTTRFPEVWPPDYRAPLERLDRPIAKADVQELLSVKARRPVTVLVTRDPNGLVGWTAFDVYFG